MKAPKTYRQKAERTPASAWYVCLACFAIGFVIVAALDAFVYFSVISNDVQAQSAAVSENVITRSTIGDAASALRTRDAAAATVPSVPNPAL